MTQNATFTHYKYTCRVCERIVYVPQGDMSPPPTCCRFRPGNGGNTMAYQGHATLTEAN